MVRLRINLGRRQSVLPPQLIGLVNQATQTRNIRLGRIDISTDWTDFQVEAAMADKVEAALRGFDYRGVKIRVERGADNREPRGRAGGPPPYHKGRRNNYKTGRSHRSHRKYQK